MNEATKPNPYSVSTRQPFAGTEAFFLIATVLTVLGSCAWLSILVTSSDPVGSRDIVMFAVCAFITNSAMISITLIVKVLVDIARSLRR